MNSGKKHAALTLRKVTNSIPSDVAPSSLPRTFRSRPSSSKSKQFAKRCQCFWRSTSTAGFAPAQLTTWGCRKKAGCASESRGRERGAAGVLGNTSAAHINIGLRATGTRAARFGHRHLLTPSRSCFSTLNTPEQREAQPYPPPAPLSSSSGPSAPGNFNPGAWRVERENINAEATDTPGTLPDLAKTERRKNRKKRLRRRRAIADLESLGLSVTVSESRSTDADTDTDEGARGHAPIDTSAEDSRFFTNKESVYDPELLSKLPPRWKRRYLFAISELEEQGLSVSVSQSRSTDVGANTPVDQDGYSKTHAHTHAQHPRVGTEAKTRGQEQLSKLESLEDLRAAFMELLERTEKAISEQRIRPAPLSPYPFSSAPGPSISPELDPSMPFHTARDFRKSNHATLPVYSFSQEIQPPRVVYVRTYERANAELTQLFFTGPREQAVRIVGFDLEWRSSARPDLPEHPVALVQLAAADTVLLLQVSAMEMFPSKLIEVLDNETIIKAGVGILGDAQRLYRDFAVTMRSCVELSYLARCVDRDRWPGELTELISLARLVHAYRGRSLPKGKMQMSNWEDELTEQQLHYAANDAHAGMNIGASLLKRAHHLDRSLFMFNVVQANAVRADGRSWHVRDCPPPPPPARKRTSSLVDIRSLVDNPLEHVRPKAMPPAEKNLDWPRESKLLDTLRNFVKGDLTATATAASASEASEINVGTGVKPNLDPFGWESETGSREVTSERSGQASVPSNPLGGGRHVQNTARTADPWTYLPLLLSGFRNQP